MVFVRLQELIRPIARLLTEYWAQGHRLVVQNIDNSNKSVVLQHPSLLALSIFGTPIRYL